MTQSSRSETIYYSLRRAIIEQALRPGMKLPEDTIGEQFGVSRTSVRNALVRLSAEGLVDVQPNRGACVAEPTLEEALDIFSLRRCLEREVANRLSRQITPAQLAKLEAHVREEQAALGSEGPLSMRLAGEFHILLAQLTGSRPLTRYVSEIVSRCSLILALYSRPHSSRCGLDEHRQIIEALRKGDPERAVAVMGQHIEAVEERAEIREHAEEPDVRAILGEYAKSA
ncbi:MAG: GntR family transcriptional regulator [Rhizobiales bacterium 65-79]|jgi:DNA-binding GntR family transcriptional regulator|nr:GntR family transcriptional regulator [Hyphomicrobiales bacterium]OJU07055.1 MAG: GntR family transcriptional regulator [Rhizobiales bacterium 65-79]